MTKLSFFKKAKNKVKNDVEFSARRKLIDDLFQDFNRSRAQVYRMNFFRGIFFGLGSVIGGTIVVAIVASILSFFVDIPGVGDSFQRAQQSIESGVRSK